MSFLHIANFDFHGGSAADFDRYDSTGAISWASPGGKFNGGYIQATTGTANLIYTVSDFTQRSGWATFYFKRGLDSGVNSEFLVINGPAAIHFWIEIGNSARKGGVSSDHQIILLNYDDTLLGQSISTWTGGEGSPSDWIHVEAFWTLGQGDGIFKLWVDGVLEIDVSSLTIGNTGGGDTNNWRRWRFDGPQGFLSAGSYLRLDNFVLQDGSGTALLDGHRIYSDLPDSDGAVTQWTPSSGSVHFSLVNETNPDQDTTYVESSAADDREEFGLPATSASINIKAVSVKALCTRASGTGNIRLGLDVSGQELISSDITVNGSVYKEAQSVFVTRPAGGAWTQADLNNITILMEATAAGVRTTQVWVEVLVAADGLPDTPTVFIDKILVSSVNASTTAFVPVTPPASGSHSATQWQITTSADPFFLAPSYDPGDDVVNKTSIVNVGSLTKGVNYLMRARHKEDTSVYSAWSAAVAFTVPFSAELIAAVGAEFWWMVLSGSNRQGTYITVPPGSPHISIEPLDFIGTRYVGDIYMVPAGTDASPGLKIIDSNVSTTLYTGSFVTSLRNSTAESVSAIFGGLDNPTSSYLAARSIISDEGFITVTSNGQGALVRNETWQGGFYMPDSSTVSLLVAGLTMALPTGSQFFISNSLNLQEGRIYIRGNSASFIMDGSGSSAYINHQHWVHMTSSVTSVVNVGAGTPVLDEGTFLYVIPAGAQIDESHIRTSGSWYPVGGTASIDPIDGGTY